MLMQTETARYAKCIEVSKRMRWDIDRDVIRGRAFDFSKKFLPDGLSKVDRLVFLTAAEQRLLSQIQGRTYANIFGLVERFIAAKVLEVSREHWLGDQTALEALVRFSDEELKHQEMFRRIEQMIGAGMPAGYAFRAGAERGRLGRARQVDLGGARAHLPHRALRAGALPREHRAATPTCPSCGRTSSSTTGARNRSTRSSTSWSGCARTRSSRRAERDQAVNELIELVGRGGRDPAGPVRRRRRLLPEDRRTRVHRSARRRRSGPACSRPTAGSTSCRACRAAFSEVLGGMIDAAQGERIGAALAPIMQ